MKLPEVVIFDNDNTLIRTLPHSVASANHVWAHYGLPVMSEEEFCKSYSQPYIDFLRYHGVRKTEKRFWVIPPEVPEAEIWKVYAEVYEKDFYGPCDGVLQTLDLFRSMDLPMGVVSLTSNRITERRIEVNGLSSYFRRVCGGPFPESCKSGTILDLCREFRVELGRVWFVGDVPDDMQNARQAGVVPVGLLSPLSRTAQDLRDAGAEEVFQSHAQLCLVVGESRGVLT